MSAFLKSLLGPDKTVTKEFAPGQTLTLTYNQDRLNQIFIKSAQGIGDDNAKAVEYQNEYLYQVLTGWDLKDERAGEVFDIPLTRESIEGLPIGAGSVIFKMLIEDLTPPLASEPPSPVTS